MCRLPPGGTLTRTLHHGRQAGVGGGDAREGVNLRLTARHRVEGRGMATVGRRYRTLELRSILLSSLSPVGEKKILSATVNVSV